MYFKRLTFIILVSALLIGVISCKEDAVEPSLYGAIEGKVLDSETNLPISNAAVTTSPPTSSIVTDANGEFKFPSVPTGSYTISVKKSDYASNSISVSVTEGAVTEATILLSVDEGSVTGTPVLSKPANKSENLETEINLSWTVETQSAKDSIKYDVYLYSENSLQQERVAENLKDTLYTIENLKFNTTYFWQIAVKGGEESDTYSPVWSFKTKSFPDYPYLFAGNDDGDYEIYLANDDGESLQLTNNSSKELWPQFLNDSKSLVYISDRELESHIYIQQINADEAVKITTLPIASYNNVGIGYDISPDEKYIIYGHYDKLYRVGTDGRGLTQLATASNGFHFREVSYSDQGDKIVALLVGAEPYTSEIYILNANGSNMELFMEDVPGSLGSPSFSVDGTKILFTRDLSGNEVSSGRQLNTHVQLVTLDKSDTIDVSSKKADGTNDLFPRFSPDGGKIIFMNGSNSSNATEIWTMDSNGENRTMIHPNGKYPYWK